MIVVAPYVGAWIETDKRVEEKRSSQSHPMWVRGLKHAEPSQFDIEVASHPMWVRGLKHSACCPRKGYTVAPYVGAWIETLILIKRQEKFRVAPYVGAWIETW